MAKHKSIFTLLDYSDEKSSVNIYNGAITAVSIGGFLTQFGEMRTALEGITLGTMHQEQWIGDVTLLSNARPASPVAQRESKFLVRYHNVVTGKKFTLEIPTADLTGRVVAGTDRALLTETNMAAFVTAFNAFARSPENDTDAVVIDDILVVGRNL